MEDIISKKVQLPHLVQKQLAQSKINFISNKLPFIPAKLRGYYPGATEAEKAEREKEKVPPKRSNSKGGQRSHNSMMHLRASYVPYLAGQMNPMRLVEKEVQVLYSLHVDSSEPVDPELVGIYLNYP